MMSQTASGKPPTLSLLEHTPVECLTSFQMRDQIVNLCLDRPTVGVERTANQSVTLLRPIDHVPGTRSCSNAQQTSFLPEGDKVDKMAAQYESSLFSSSLSELFSRKLRLSSNIASYGHSAGTVVSHYEEEEPFESLEEIEAQTIGNLLPDDEDLFSGVIDGLDYTIHPTGGEDMDELDFFNSVGGMDLGDDGSSAAQKKSEISTGFSNGELGLYNGAIAREHMHGEHPSRTLFVRNIYSTIEDSELKALFEQYGDIHTLYTACKHLGFVMISYYDIRAAQSAMTALQNKLIRHRKLDIHYAIPKDNPSEKDINQGTLVVFSLDSSVSNDELRQIFGVYGEIKEIREAPHKSHQKFIEFYDTRAAEAALRALNRSDIARNSGGSKWCLENQFLPELEQDERGPCLPQNSPPNKSTNEYPGAFASSSSGTDNGIVSGRMESISTQSGLAGSGHLQGPFKFDIQSTSSLLPQSLPLCYDSLTNGVHCHYSAPMAANINIKPPDVIDNRQLSRVSSNEHSIGLTEGVFGSTGSGSCPLPGHQYGWSNSYCPQPQGMMWPNSLSMVNGICNIYSPARLHGLSRAPSHMVNTVLPVGNHHVGSAPAVDPSLWERHHAYVGESPEASGLHPGSLGRVRISNNNSLHSMEFLSHNIFPPRVDRNCINMPIPSKNVGFQSHHQRLMMFSGRGQMIPLINSFDDPSERARNRRNEVAANQADKKQYELDIDRILRGEDNRTTLMIKNIPNKYTSKMLLAAIDERHKGTYDFIYLPIDFKNKCNVGYAFINMTDPSQIISFYQTFDGKKWEKFNSEKVALLAYARIQGKAALVAHFQNSSLMNEDKRCRPILFNTDGPNAGDQVPFPMGANVRTRLGKPRNITHEENYN